MISTTDPESMTAEARRLEVAGILALGVLRRVRLAKVADSASRQTASEEPRKGLDVPAETRLSVAPRSAGCLRKPIPLYGTGRPVEWVNAFILGYLGRRSDTLYTIPIMDNRCILPDGAEVAA
jgi:hypothetical protein